MPWRGLSAGFHVGFVLDRSSEVRSVYDRLKAGIGMKLERGVQGPALVFQRLGPDNIPVEVRAPKDSWIAGVEGPLWREPCSYRT